MARILQLRRTAGPPRPDFFRRARLALSELFWRLNDSRPVNEVSRADMELLFDSTYQ